MINETNKTITVEAPFATGVTALVATFTTSGDEATVNTVEQVTDVTVNDFTHPVIYTVEASDGSTVDYTVTVIVGLNDVKDITSFTILNQTASDISVTEISVSMPAETDVTALVPEITHTGAGINPACFRGGP